MLFLRKLKAFIVKDMLIETSYKTAFVLGIVSTLLPVFLYYFMGKFMSGANPVPLDKYGEDYFSYVIIGIAYEMYFNMSLMGYFSSIRNAQISGCLESILGSQTSHYTVALMSSFYSFLVNGVLILLIFLISILFLGFDYHHVNLPSALLVFAISWVCLVSLGIFAGAVTIVIKQAENFILVLSMITSILAGTYFPISTFPAFFQYLSRFIPLTYILEAFRLAILQGYPVGMLWPRLVTLALMAAVLLPLSLLCFHWVVERGKRNGTIMQY
jgi:ABC-2 type transport system permease protein